jgi:hypothetical protein
MGVMMSDAVGGGSREQSPLEEVTGEADVHPEEETGRSETETEETGRGGPAVTRRPDDPGAHSGAESEPQDRVIPGTASAAEGYAGSSEGTAAGEPLDGLEVEPADAALNEPQD